MEGGLLGVYVQTVRVYSAYSYQNNCSQKTETLQCSEQKFQIDCRESVNPNNSGAIPQTPKGREMHDFSSVNSLFICEMKF